MTENFHSNRLCKDREAYSAEDTVRDFFETYSTWNWERVPVALRPRDLEGQGCESLRYEVHSVQTVKVT